MQNDAIKNALVFPGQGSQFVGMARDLFDAHESVRELYAEAAEILCFDLAALCFNGPEEALKQTDRTQPAIFVHSVALTRFALENGLLPAMVAGHSLGEYSALCAAGAFTFADGLRLVKVRGELMQKAGEISPGTMAAVMGLDAETLRDICDTANKSGVVTVANFNSPAQIVISGSLVGVEKAMALAGEKGARKVVPLVVGGAFHSPLMEFAVEGLSSALETVRIVDANIPVFSNVTAEAVTAAADIKKLLVQQLISPVRWVESVENMIAAGAGCFYEIGPGSVLTGLMRRIDRSVRCRAINSLETLAKLTDGQA